MADADRFDLTGDPIVNEDYGQPQPSVRLWEPGDPPSPDHAAPAAFVVVDDPPTDELLPIIAAAHGHGSAGVIGQAGAQSVLDALAAGGFKVVRA